MGDAERAKALLSDGQYTCVLCREDACLTSKSRGISPMLDWIREGRKLDGFSAADTIVGKAAAMLFVLAGVRSVYGRVMSEAGRDYLTARGVACSYETLAAQINSRNGDGVCSMEQAVAQLEDAETAYAVLLEKRDAMRRNHK